LDWGVGVEGGVPRSRGVSVEGEEGESGTASPQGGGESGAASEVVPVEREFFIDSLLVRIHHID